MNYKLLIINYLNSNNLKIIQKNSNYRKAILFNFQYSYLEQFVNKKSRHLRMI